MPRTTYTLRPDQQNVLLDAINFLRVATPGMRRPYIGPTGSGKSLPMLELQGHIPGLWIVTPKVEIIRDMLAKLGVATHDMSEARLLAAGWAERLTTPVRLRNALLNGQMEPPTALCFDELHHHTAETNQQIDWLCGTAPAVGFTATYFRGTPAGTAALRNAWGDPYTMISYPAAVAAGIISMPSCVILPLVDDDAITVTGGEFQVTTAGDAVISRLSAIVDWAASQTSNRRFDRPTMFATPNTESCLQLTEALEAAGVNAASVTQATTQSQRYTAFARCLSSNAALVQINVVSEGVDLSIRRLIDLSPDMSPVRWLQKFGRATRPGGESQYVCVAEGTPILTLLGWRAIEDVTPEDVVWDGQEWVSHDGVVCKGVEEVVEVAGVELTPTHRVLSTEGWVEACLADSTVLQLGMYSTNGRYRLLADCVNADVLVASSEVSPTPTSSTIDQSDVVPVDTGCSQNLVTPRSGYTQLPLAYPKVTTSPSKTLGYSSTTSWVSLDGPTDGFGLTHASGRFVRVYDLVNAGPRHRYQAGALIVANCTNRNLIRHAYLLEGCLPPATVAEATKAFGGPGTRYAQRVLGLEALGRLRASDLPLADGTLGLCYQMSSVEGITVTEYTCLVHPAKAAPLWAKRTRYRATEGTEARYGRWARCNAPEGLEGFASIPASPPSPKQQAWWDKAAKRHGLDPAAKVTRKNFAALPVLSDLRTKL